MAIADLSSVLKIFGDSSSDEAEQQELYAEVLLMVLARASSSDANIDPVEIETIQQIMQRETGEELTSADIRKAGRSELYETVNLRKYLRSVRYKLAEGDALKVVQGLADVINSDSTVSVLEVDFFNRVADSLRVSPAELAGLVA